MLHSAVSVQQPAELAIPKSVKTTAVTLPGEVAVRHSAASAQQPAELALLAVLRPVLPTCSKGKRKVYPFQRSRQGEPPKAAAAQHSCNKRLAC